MASTSHSSCTSVLKEVSTVGLDLAKTTVQFVGLDASRRVLTRRLNSKDKLLRVTPTIHPCWIGMEACCGAHLHLIRQLLAQGYGVRLTASKVVGRTSTGSCHRALALRLSDRWQSGRGYRDVLRPRF